jgi:hypothetical protein
MGQEPRMSKDDKPAKTYFFFVGTTKYETEQSVVSGAYVKSRIVNLPEGSGLELEGHGNDVDKPFSDTDTVSLELGHGEGPRRFNIVPPANFG